MTRIGPDRLERTRAIPPETVARALGYRSDPHDPWRRKRDGSILGIDGPRFYDHLNQRGGGGAIDRVIHATGCRFPDALRLLDGLAPQGPDMPHERTAGAPPRKPRQLRLPPDAPSAWTATTRPPHLHPSSRSPCEPNRRCTRATCREDPD